MPSALIGQSAALRELKEEITRVAHSDAKVLITGESGTGKELVARAIHQQSARGDRAFVPVNCAGLTETLLESELFGYLKGSFTGAYRDRPGKLEAADKGTIMLDEIGEMTPRMQGLLLRFLETGEVQKVGSDRIDRRVNVRVVAATNRNLAEMVGQGLFREDLFYRINVVHLCVPPLSARKEDIPTLVEHFLARFTGRAHANGNAHVNITSGRARTSKGAAISINTSCWPICAENNTEPQAWSGDTNATTSAIHPPMNDQTSSRFDWCPFETRRRKPRINKAPDTRSAPTTTGSNDQATASSLHECGLPWWASTEMNRAKVSATL